MSFERNGAFVVRYTQYFSCRGYTDTGMSVFLSIDKKEIIRCANKYRINPNKPLVAIITITAIIAMIKVIIPLVFDVFSI